MSMIILVDDEKKSVYAIDGATGVQKNAVNLVAHTLALAVRPDHEHIAVATDTGTLILNSSLKVMHTLVTHNTHAVAYSSDGSYIAAGEASGSFQVRLYNTTSFYDHVADGAGHLDAVRGVAFSPKSTSIVSCSKDHTAIVWAVPSMTARHVLTGHKQSVRAVAYISESIVATGGHDKIICFWDVETAKCIHELKSHSDMVNVLALSTDGKSLISGSDDHTIKISDIYTYACKATVKCPGIISSMCVAEGSQLIVGVPKHQVMIVDIDTGVILSTLEQSPKFLSPLGVVCIRHSTAYKEALEKHTSEESISDVLLRADRILAPTMIVTPSCQLRSICPAYPHSHLAATTSLQAADSPAIPRVHTPPKPSTVEPSTDGAQQRSGWCICCHPWIYADVCIVTPPTDANGGDHSRRGSPAPSHRSGAGSDSNG